MSDLSAADVMAMTNDNGWNNNPFIYLVWLALLGGGNWFGNRGNSYDSAAVQGGLTRADMFEGFNNQDVNSQLRGITSGICDGFYAVNSGMLNGFNTVERGIGELGYAMKDGFCSINRNIDDVKAEAYKNTCAITTAIHDEGESIKALITQNTIQDLRDRLVAKDQELQTANYQISQQAQTAQLIGSLRPFPQPSYITCSPYSASNNCGCGV